MKQVSIWAESVAPPVFEKLTGRHSCDVAVAGGGLTGLTTALLLQRAGARVMVVEANALGNGTSGRTTAKITWQHGTALSGLSNDKALAYSEVNQAGLSLVASLIGELGIDCGFERLPAYVYARSDDEEKAVQKEFEVYKSLRLNGQLVSETQLPFDVRCALAVEDQAQFHPLSYLYALADELQKNGAVIFEHSPVLEIERNDHGVKLITGHGALQAETAVLATGYPLVEFPGLFFLKLHQERSYIIAAQSKEPLPFGMYINAGNPVNSVRSYNKDGVNWLLVGGYGHKTGQEDDKQAGLAPLSDFLNAYFPYAQAYCGWSAQDCVTLDGLPYVGGLYKKGPQVYVATGYAKWGMTNSAAAAMMIADDYSGKSNLIDKETRAFFSPLRVAPAASAKGFAQQAATTVRTYAAEHVGLPELNPDEIKPGEGLVGQIKGHVAAVGRSKDGTLHILKARCTHLGCPLEYNEESHSFDCQCHGSRFGLDGQVINGPAKQKLGSIDDDE